MGVIGCVVPSGIIWRWIIPWLEHFIQWFQSHFIIRRMNLFMNSMWDDLNKQKEYKRYRPSDNGLRLQFWQGCVMIQSLTKGSRLSLHRISNVRISSHSSFNAYTDCHWIPLSNNLLVGSIAVNAKSETHTPNQEVRQRNETRKYTKKRICEK